jgi:hypothetical protein
MRHNVICLSKIALLVEVSLKAQIMDSLLLMSSLRSGDYAWIQQLLFPAFAEKAVAGVHDLDVVLLVF